MTADEMQTVDEMRLKACVEELYPEYDFEELPWCSTGPLSSKRLVLTSLLYSRKRRHFDPPEQPLINNPPLTLANHVRTPVRQILRSEFVLANENSRSDA